MSFRYLRISVATIPTSTIALPTTQAAVASASGLTIQPVNPAEYLVFEAV